MESGQTGGEEVGNNDGWVIEKNPPNASVSFLGYFFCNCLADGLFIR